MRSFIVKHRLLIIASIALLLLPLTVRVARDRLNQIRWSIYAAQAAQNPRTEFTLYITEVVRKGARTEGPGVIALQKIIAQRRDGAKSETTINHPGRSLEHKVRVITQPDMVHIQTWDSVGLKATGKPLPSHLVSKMAARRQSPESDCALTMEGQPAFPSMYRKIGKGLIRGISAVQFLRDGKARSYPTTQVWLAPQLDCQEVYSLSTFLDDSGQITDSSEKFMTNYAVGEPDPSLFDASNLRETNPIEAHEINYRKANYPEDFIQKVVAEMKATSRPR